MDRVQLGAIGKNAQNIAKNMIIHIITNKLHKNAMLMKLLNYALKVERFDQALNRSPLAC